MILKKFIPLVVIIMSIGAVSLHAQVASNYPDKKIEKIVGTWKVKSILADKKTVAKNPTSGQWIRFQSNGRYVHQANALDSGSYRVDENRSVLYLESDIIEDASSKPSEALGEWSLTFKDDTMILQRKGDSPHTDKMKYVYVQIGEGSISRN